MPSPARTVARLAGGAVVALFAAGASLAQDPGTAFTYQGRLESGGAPASGLHDLRFRLWLSESDPNSPFGPALCKDNVMVSDGLFTTELDFGPDVLLGFPLWLEVQVRADATPGNCEGGAYTTLAPRQPLKPAPYAVWATTAQTAIGLRYPFNATSTVGVLLNLTNTSNGANTSTGLFQNTSTGSNSRALTAYATGGTGATYGVYAQSNSSAGVGVYGQSSGPVGVHGEAVRTSGTADGVRGESGSSSGRGVYGLASAAGGTTYGVYGQSASPNGYGGYFVGARNYFSGNLGIGTAAPSYQFEVNAGTTGLTPGAYIRNSGSGIVASFDGLGSGGGPAVTCFKQNGTALLVTSTSSSSSAPLVVSGGTDGAPSGGGYIVCGSTNSTNLAIDNNEIQARNNNAAADLYLNNSGGNLLLNGLAGNTGIGTGAPAYKLDVNGGLRPRGGIYFNGALPPIAEAQGGNFFTFGYPGHSEDQLVYLENELLFWDSPGGGDSSHPQIRAADFVTISDVRLKTDIRPIEGALERVRRLRGIEYRFDGAKIDPQADSDAPQDRLRLGFAAQEMLEVVPEAVSYTPELDVYGVSHGTLVPLLVEALKEQQRTIEEHSARLEAQADMIAALRADIEALNTARAH